MSEKFDIIVIGSGPGGYRAAVLATLRKQSVAIVEKADWGGCCLNRGCVPKKDWHHTAQLLAASREFAARGIQGSLSPDFEAAWEHQEAVVATVQESYINYMKRLGIKAVNGHGKLLDANTVVVTDTNGNETQISAENIIIATGSSAHIPEGITPVAGKILTTDMLFDERPPKGKRVALIGSGVIGTEFAFILTMLGLEVVWLTGSAPLSKTLFSPQARNTLNEAMKRHGIEARQGARLQSAKVEGEQVVITLQNGSSETVDWLLLGTGRTPYTDNLGLNSLGIQTNGHGFIQCNEYLQTSVPNIYAIGDCRSEVMTANQALADADVVVENIIHDNSSKEDPLWVPMSVYGAVELARIGMDEDMAEDEELEPAVGFAAFETSPRALGQSDSDGFVRLIADMDSGDLLGGEIVGSEAAELIHMLTLAPNPQEALKLLANAHYNHPARAEELQNAVQTMANKWGLAEHIFGD